jgi:hypothetical protein
VVALLPVDTLHRRVVDSCEFQTWVVCSFRFVSFRSRLVSLWFRLVFVFVLVVAGGRGGGGLIDYHHLVGGSRSRSPVHDVDIGGNLKTLNTRVEARNYQP